MTSANALHVPERRRGGDLAGPPPAASGLPADRLEQRVLAGTSLALFLLALVATAAFPLLRGLDPVGFALNAATTAGLGMSHVLVRRGDRRAGAFLMLGILVAEVWAIVLRVGPGPLHGVLMLATLLPVILALALRRVLLAAAIASVTLAYGAFHVVRDPSNDQTLTTIVVFVGGLAIAGLGPVLRARERRAAASAQTAKRRAEAAAQGMLENLREAQKLAHIGSWDLDLRTGIGTWSDEMYRLYGKDPATFVPNLEGSLATVPPEERAQVLASFNAAMASRAGVDIEHRVMREDGTRRFVHERGLFSYDDAGAAVRAFGTTQDITERKEMEAARAAVEREQDEVRRLDELSRLRADILNAAAHDLRTPLTPLKLQLATLRARAAGDPRQQAGFDLMGRSIDRLQRLVDDMLDAARLQAGRMALRRQDVDVGAVVRETVASFQEAAAAAGVRLDASIAQAAVVHADPARLQQVLANLVSNAVKYTPRGGHASVRLDADGAEARIEVADSGLGMTPEQLARLFQPFMRLHEATAAAVKGTGLGLYISKGLVEQHGGRLWATSPGPGLGTTFHVALPAAWRS